MRFIDVSMRLHDGMLIYPGDVPFSRREDRRMKAGDALNLSSLTLGAHTGTHVDAPYHFLGAAGKTTDELPPDAFSGPAPVLPLEEVEAVGARELEPHDIREGDVVLLKTSNSRYHDAPFRADHVHLTEDGADHLLARRVKAVGIDYLSVEAFGHTEASVHRRLLGDGVGIIEGLHLADVTPGRYWLLCLPLRIVGGDGAPARALLVEGWPDV